MNSGVPLWVVLLVGLASPLASFGTAAITVYLTNKREMRRLDQDRELKEAEFEDRRRKDLRDERRKAYSKMHDITRTINPTEPYEFEDLSEAFATVELLTNSPDVLASAWRLYGKANDARNSGRAAFQDGVEDVANHPHTRAAFEESQELRKEFLRAAREELELPPLPTLEQALLPKPIVMPKTPEEQSQAPKQATFWQMLTGKG